MARPSVGTNAYIASKYEVSVHVGADKADNDVAKRALLIDNG